ncbi:MAG: glycosyltransferase family 39 protein [Acidocella sp.]|nr:glycosyltransferase family 39 protein [Acidocella sp.]
MIDATREMKLTKPDFAAVVNHVATLPLVVFGVALILRLIDIGARPFWLDEVFTLQRVHMPLAALVHDSFANHHMPSYFLMLSPLAGLGDPQFWLRVPSALFGAACVMLVFLITVQIAGRRAGLLAALILGLSPSALAFSQEARSYTMEMSLILIALYSMVQLALNLPAASRPWADRRSMRGAWLAFVLGTAGALDVLGDGVPWLITANIIGFVILRRSPSRQGFLRNLLLADAVMVTLTAPFYMLMEIYQDKKFIDSVTWIPPLDLSHLWYDFSSVYLMRIADTVSFRLMNVTTPMPVIWLIEAGLLLAAALGAWRLRRRPGMLAVIGLSFILLPAVLLVISLWRSMLVPRYILWSAAPFAILAGIGCSVLLQRLPRYGQTVAFGAMAAVLLFNLLPYYHVETKPRWDIAAKILASEVAPGDVVLLSDPWDDTILRAYLPPDAQNIVLSDSQGGVTHAQLAQMQGKRVWVVIGHAGQIGSTQHQLPDNFAKIAPLGAPAKIEMAGGRIYINLFAPSSPGDAASCIQPQDIKAGSANDLVLPPMPCG